VVTFPESEFIPVITHLLTPHNSSGIMHTQPTDRSDMGTQLYRHFDGDNNLLYVGVSLSTFNRLSQHRDHSEWFKKIGRVEIEHFETRPLALEAEKKAIKTEKPKFNRAHKRTLAEIDNENRLIAAAEQRALTEKNKYIHKYVNYYVAYQLDHVRQMLFMTKAEIARHVADGNISTFEVEGRGAWRGKGGKKMVSGWSLIDFIDFLERKKT
jgi:predicted GIY-YIG superfamily endonuclease